MNKRKQPILVPFTIERFHGFHTDIFKIDTRRYIDSVDWRTKDESSVFDRMQFRRKITQAVRHYGLQKKHRMKFMHQLADNRKTKLKSVVSWFYNILNCEYCDPKHKEYDEHVDNLNPVWCLTFNGSSYKSWTLYWFHDDCLEGLKAYLRLANA